MENHIKTAGMERLFIHVGHAYPWKGQRAISTPWGSCLDLTRHNNLEYREYHAPEYFCRDTTRCRQAFPTRQGLVKHDAVGRQLPPVRSVRASYSRRNAAAMLDAAVDMSL